MWTRQWRQQEKLLSLAHLGEEWMLQKGANSSINWGTWWREMSSILRYFKFNTLNHKLKWNKFTSEFHFFWICLFYLELGYSRQRETSFRFKRWFTRNGWCVSLFCRMGRQNYRANYSCEFVTLFYLSDSTGCFRNAKIGTFLIELWSFYALIPPIINTQGMCCENTIISKFHSNFMKRLSIASDILLRNLRISCLMTLRTENLASHYRPQTKFGAR